MVARAWRTRSLTLRVLVLLSLALMPLGAISVWQTQRIAAQSVARAEAALRSRTEHAVNPIQAALERAFGAAEALGPTIVALAEDPAACSVRIGRFVAEAGRYSYAAFVPADGTMRCSADGREFDFAATPNFAASFADPRASVSLVPDGPLSGRPVLVVSIPQSDGEGAVAGFLTLSVPVADLAPRPNPEVEGPAPSLVVFNERGQVLLQDPAGSDEGVAPETLLPRDRTFTALARGGEGSFSDADTRGEDRVFAVVAIVPDMVYALSSWSREAIWAGSFDKFVLTGLMPVLMWVASLLVAVLALERLVFRHIRAIGRQMRTFAGTRRMLRQPMLAGAGAEIGAIESDFRDMAQSILQDEAALEDNLREKNILLKEVHHRVKNNLQLISSIMNMQARRLSSREARDVLRRVQDRVMGLAAVHRSLYMSPDLGRIDAGAVVGDLARQIALTARTGGAGAIGLDLEAEAISLPPDEAVTLSLTVSEAMTNAVEQQAAAGPEGASRPILLRLRREEGRRARLVIENACTPGRADATADGLGLQLVRAFARQLDGELEMAEREGTFRFELAFPLDHHRATGHDY